MDLCSYFAYMLSWREQGKLYLDSCSQCNVSDIYIYIYIYGTRQAGTCRGRVVLPFGATEPKEWQNECFNGKTDFVCSTNFKFLGKIIANSIKVLTFQVHTLYWRRQFWLLATGAKSSGYAISTKFESRH